MSFQFRYRVANFKMIIWIRPNDLAVLVLTQQTSAVVYLKSFYLQNGFLNRVRSMK